MASKQRGDVAQMKGALNFFLKTHILLKGFLKKLKVGENLQNTFNTLLQTGTKSFVEVVEIKKKRTLHKRQVINCEEEFLMLYFGFVGRPVHVRG